MVTASSVLSLIDGDIIGSPQAAALRSRSRVNHLERRNGSGTLTTPSPTRPKVRRTPPGPSAGLVGVLLLALRGHDAEAQQGLPQELRVHNAALAVPANGARRSGRLPGGARLGPEESWGLLRGLTCARPPDPRALLHEGLDRVRDRRVHKRETAAFQVLVADLKLVYVWVRH